MNGCAFFGGKDSSFTKSQDIVTQIEFKPLAIPFTSGNVKGWHTQFGLISYGEESQFTWLPLKPDNPSTIETERKCEWERQITEMKHKAKGAESCKKCRPR
ncbi:hypothetical protein CBL_01773 [Carabus blaptoides fortunei]